MNNKQSSPDAITMTIWTGHLIGENVLFKQPAKKKRLPINLVAILRIYNQTYLYFSPQATKQLSVILY